MTSLSKQHKLHVHLVLGRAETFVQQISHEHGHTRMTTLIHSCLTAEIVIQYHLQKAQVEICK